MEQLTALVAAVLVAGWIFPRFIAEPAADKRALLDFARGLPHGHILNWQENSTVCNNWDGVVCSSDGLGITGVNIPGLGLSTRIPRNTLSRLLALQTLNLASNEITGPFPSDLTNIRSLVHLHLQLNNFSGPLPWTLSSWRNLTVLDVSFNAFSGYIPSSISTLSRLITLNLSNNALYGKIPDFNLPNLRQLSLANNNLKGTIPKSLQKFPTSSFAGNNIQMAVPALLPSSLSTPVPSPSCFPRRRKKKLGESFILGVAAGSSLFMLAVLALFLIVRFSKKKAGNGFSGKMEKRNRSPEKAGTGSQDENRLVFFEGCRYAFDLEDLLRASAEVLGKGTFGTAYKAILEDSSTVVVKRLKEVTAGKREFEQQMELVGRIRHENVVDVRAYYYSKDEKLIVYDYYSQGSVSSLLHGKRGDCRTPLDWESRVKIAIGTARGVARIHMENSGKLVHGNIKSSNIFVNSQWYGCVCDLGLTALTNTPVPHPRVAGYRAPEVIDWRKASQASDVYSVGVMMLELLTGKSPVQPTGGDEVVHLVRWVQSVVREEWTVEVFDVALIRYPNIEEELVEMLQIAMSCVARTPEQRPKMGEVVKMLEDIRRDDTGNRLSSEADVKSEPIADPPGARTC